MSENKSIEFKIGELSGQVTSLVASMRDFMEALTRLEGKVERALNEANKDFSDSMAKVQGRITDTELDIRELKTRAAMWGGLTGIAGAIFIQVVILLIQHFITP